MLRYLRILVKSGFSKIGARCIGVAKMASAQTEHRLESQSPKLAIAENVPLIGARSNVTRASVADSSVRLRGRKQ